MVRRTRHYWANRENRRQFFLDFARQRGFDPLIAANWQRITTADIVTKKVLAYIMRIPLIQCFSLN